MAYDPKDPADKKIVDDAVKAAVAKREGELVAEHEAEVEGLVTKRDELLAKVRKMRAGGGGEGGGADDGEIERLDRELAQAKKDLRAAQTALRTATEVNEQLTGERDTAMQERDAERETARTDFLNSQLTSGLSAAKVPGHFIEDLIPSLSRKAEVKVEGGERKAFVDGKPLSDFFTAWSEGPGKNYIAAPVNDGGGSPPGGGGGAPGAKRISDMNDAERVAAFKANPEDFDKRVAAGEGQPLPAQA